MKKKRRRAALKRTLASALGMVLVVTLTIAGTLAFVKTVSGEKINTFTGTSDIRLYLEEPSYNLRESKDTSGTVTYSVKNTANPDPREYVPGVTYPKDPTLYNTTGKQTKSDNSEELAEEWVAMKVEYTLNGTETNHDGLTNDTPTISDGKITKKGGIIQPIVFDEDNTTISGTKTGNWIRIPSSLIGSGTINYDIFVYKYKLKAKDGFTNSNIANTNDGDTALLGTTASGSNGTGVRTTPLFSQIVIKSEEELEANGYDIKDLEKFEIKLTGAAIKVTSSNNITQIVSGDITDTSKQSGVIVEDLISLLR